MRAFKKYLMAGLLIWAPLVITIWLLWTMISTLESILPESLSAKALLGVDVPGLRFLIVLLILLLTGALTANFLGQAVVDRWERLMGRIPLIRSIYNSVKQVGDTLLAPNGQAFRQAVLVQYPREGAWTIAFVTGVPGGEAARHLSGDYVSVYVPTTPNPTSGFFLMVPRADIVALSMSVDAALKYIVSMGAVAPPTPPQESH